jgi:hypothetical protein
MAIMQIETIKDIDTLEANLKMNFLLPMNLSFVLEFSPHKWQKLVIEMTSRTNISDKIKEIKYVSKLGTEWTLKLRSYKYK